MNEPGEHREYEQEFLRETVPVTRVPKGKGASTVYPFESFKEKKRETTRKTQRDTERNTRERKKESEREMGREKEKERKIKKKRE